MCGITGAAWTDPEKAIDEALLGRMTECLRHRGPDEGGTHREELRLRPPYGTMPGVALGSRRLAIIDVAGGHQPICNEDQTVWIVFNGEIYNHRELRRRLEGTGHHFLTRSDTEVLVHLYEDEGPQMLAHLNGMFGLAIWDSRRGELFLARDRLGKKPLYYRHERGRLLFGSELKSILEVPDVPREVSPQAIDAYLAYQYVPHPQTIFRGISKLPPAHYAVYCDDKLTIRSYWEPDFNIEEHLPVEEYRQQLRELLTSAVQMRLESEVPLGAFLSGGIDSTIIVGLMQELMQEPVRTFSIGFPEPEYDETNYAAMAARAFGTIHQEFRVEPDAVHILPKLVWHYDEPFADSSAVPTWYVSQLTRQHVTVALTGDAGDELFAGYDRYRAVWIASRFDKLPAAGRRALASPLWQRLPASGTRRTAVRRFKRFTSALARPPERRYFDWIGIFDEGARAELYTDEFVASLPDADPLEFLAAGFARAAARDPVTRASLADLVTYLPCDLMTKVDIASMAHSLECRQPFLDYRVVELAIRMPARYKFRRMRGKRILMETFADLLPEPIQRRGKMGFGVPIAPWFRGPLAGYAREVLLDRRSLQRGYFRPDAIQHLLDEHVTGSYDRAYRLWALLVLELWHRQWVDGEDA
jgi:asparagine synthase (glutamine-hydrolysing)